MSKMSATKRVELCEKLRTDMKYCLISNTSADWCLANAKGQAFSFACDFFAREAERRRSARIANTVRNAGFPILKRIDDYDMSELRLPEMMDIDYLTGLHFIKDKHTLVMHGICGSGKTMLMEAIRRELCESGRDQYLMYIPQEYSAEDIAAITRRIEELSDSERGEVLSDLYRLGSNPSFLLDSQISPSPGELKKLDFILSRREGRNIIMMDEPTNHLDIVSVRIFERILSSDDDFTLILVSHDESFLSSLCHIRWSIRRDGNNGILSVSSFSSICDTTQV